MKGVYLSVAQLAVEHAVDVDGVGCEGCAATFFLILIQSIKNLQQKILRFLQCLKVPEGVRMMLNDTY